MDSLFTKRLPIFHSVHIDGKEQTSRFNSLHIQQSLNSCCDFELVETISTRKTLWQGQSQELLKQVGKNVIIRLSFPRGENTFQFSGFITEVVIDSDTPMQGGSENKIRVIGKGSPVVLDDAPAMNSFVDYDLVNIVEKVFKNKYFDLICNPKFKGIIPYAMQYKESRWEFLNRLSAIYNELLYFDGSKLVFGGVTDEHSENLTIDEDITEFKVSSRTLPFKYTLYNYNAEDDEYIYSDTEEEVRPRNFYTEDVFKDYENLYLERHLLPAEEPTSLAGDIRELHQHQYQQALGKMHCVEGKTRNSLVRLGSLIYVKFPSIFEKENMGEYRVISVEHCVERDDYYNHFVAVPLGMEYPLYEPRTIAYPEIAEVVANDDPKKQGRVQVCFFWQRHLGEQTPWLRVQTPDAGVLENKSGNRGFQFIPEVGDQVMVSFEQGNPHRPYVSGSMYHGKNAQQVSHNVRSITTKSGSTITFDDEKGSVLIKDKRGSSYLLDGKGNIELNAVNKISLNSKEILLEADRIQAISRIEMELKSLVQTYITAISAMQIKGAQHFNLDGKKLTINAMESLKTTAQNLDLGAEKTLRVASEITEVHGTQAMALKSPKLDKVTQAERIDITEGTGEGIDVIVFAKPTKNYKGEFGFDYCDVGDVNISAFQGTNVADIEYIYDEATHEFVPYNSGLHNTQAQNYLKEMYYHTQMYNRPYIGSWLLLPEGNKEKGKGEKANVALHIEKVNDNRTEQEKKEKKKEYIVFEENKKFSITYKGKEDNEIKIEKKNCKGDDCVISIIAKETFSATEYIRILDERTRATVGVIEMAPNAIEIIEVKIVTVLLKTKTQGILENMNRQRENLYKKAEAQFDKINEFMRQAGIKCNFQPSGDYIVFDDDDQNPLNTDKPFFTIGSDKDGNRQVIFQDRELVSPSEQEQYFAENPFDDDEMSNKETSKDYLVDLFGRKYKALHPNSTFKGVMFFISEGAFVGRGGYTLIVPIKNQEIAVFGSNIEDARTYAHELGHLLGLQHTFVENINAFNESIRDVLNDKGIRYPDTNIDTLINSNEQNIEDREQIIEEAEEKLKQEGITQERKIELEEERANAINERNGLLLRRNDLQRRKELLEYRYNALFGQKIKTKIKTSTNIMDYLYTTEETEANPQLKEKNKKMILFSKKQSEIMRKEVGLYKTILPLLIVFFSFFSNMICGQEEYMRLMNAKTPVVVLPDILVKREIINNKMKDTIIVTNYSKGTLYSQGKKSKTPATRFKTMEEYHQFWLQNFNIEDYLYEIKGDVLVKFKIWNDGDIFIDFMNGLNFKLEFQVSSKIHSVVGSRMEKWTPATDEEGKPTITEGYLIIHFDWEGDLKRRENRVRYF